MKSRIWFSILFWPVALLSGGVVLFLSAIQIPLADPGPDSAVQTRSFVIRSSSSDEKSKSTMYEGSHALLIGMSDYTKGWPDLESIPKELEKTESLLLQYNFDVEKHMDLTGSQLMAVFQGFIEKYGYKQENRLLFYYSGHGYTRLNGRKGYIVPTDAPNPEKDEEGFLKRSIGMTQILAWAREIEAKHALFLFDSCFSGTIFKQKNLPPKPKHISKATSLPVRQFITAGSAGETVPANSVFNAVFIDALKYQWGDLNNDGYVSGTELGLYLQEKVPQHTSQTPQYGKITDYDLSRGDFIFFVGKEEKKQQASGVSKKEEAKGEKTEAGRRFPSEVKMDQYYFAAKQYAASGEHQRALLYFEKAEALDVVLPSTFSYYYGVSLFQTGAYARAAETLEKYLLYVEREDEYYQAALELLVEMENGVGRQPEKSTGRRFLLVNENKISPDLARKEERAAMDRIRKLSSLFPPKYSIREKWRSHDIKWVAQALGSCQLHYKKRASSHGVAFMDVIHKPSEESTTFEGVADFNDPGLVLKPDGQTVILGDAVLKFKDKSKADQFLQQAKKIQAWCLGQ